MITETTYEPGDLESGTCDVCDEISDEIVIDTNICVDCIEDQKFFDETMKGL